MWPLGYKILVTSPFSCDMCIKYSSNYHMNYWHGLKRVMWGHNDLDLWPAKSNNLILNLKMFLWGSPEIWQSYGWGHNDVWPTNSNQVCVSWSGLLFHIWRNSPKVYLKSQVRWTDNQTGGPTTWMTLPPNKKLIFLTSQSLIYLIPPDHRPLLQSKTLLKPHSSATLFYWVTCCEMNRAAVVCFEAIPHTAHCPAAVNTPKSTKCVLICENSPRQMHYFLLFEWGFPKIVLCSGV